MTTSEMPAGTGAGDGTVEILTGTRLQSALAALPDGLAAHVTAVAVVSDAQQDDQVEQISYWACTDGHITVHMGHTDPVAMMSVYDGSVPTTIPCGGS